MDGHNHDPARGGEARAHRGRSNGEHDRAGQPARHAPGPCAVADPRPETLRRPGRRVLLATGDERLRAAGREFLADHGYLVGTAAGGVECLARLRELAGHVAVVVLDADLLWGGADGVMDRLMRDGSPPPVVLLSSSASWHAHDGSVARPVVVALEKPVPMGALLSAIRSAAGECRA